LEHSKIREQLLSELIALRAELSCLEDKLTRR